MTTRARFRCRLFGRPAGVLGREEVETFLIHLVLERKLSPRTHDVSAAALQSVYGAAFGRLEVTEGIPRRKKPMRRPVLLSREQIAILLGAVASLKLLAIVTEPKSIRRLLRHLGEATEPPARGPPFWNSRVLRRAAHHDELFA